ncbi:MAG TPA: tRNA preQ1(34) S-adenosylmethionine ribosyltransferase-isomerase QueA [Terriglobia bacterium]|nr:tRNA preQ1(34) S-adenosylmethionine ribosyltransferase-isomerase QueA [Terriglobia bacterium]
MLLEEFAYELPKELIAQRPLKERDASRMMLLDRAAQSFSDRAFRSLPELLDPGDVLVVNNTRVFPARLLGKRRGARAQAIGKGNPAAREYLTAEVELLLTRNESGDVWQGLVHPGRKVRTGEVLVFGGGGLEAEVLGRGEYGVRRVLLRAREGSVAGAIDRLGHVPLPPYVGRPDEASDRETYQTIYARARGAVAAPTAGLHFTQRIFDALRAREIEVCEITLHVGPGTFRPVQTERVEDHKMESEQFEISEAAASTLNRALAERRRVIAVGTTSVRTLESVALENDGKIVPWRGETGLFIMPGFRFQVVRGLLTNFHLPKSTLLMLVSAFAGRDLIFRAYRHAIEQRYRFYSYGDCMLIV